MAAINGVQEEPTTQRLHPFSVAAASLNLSVCLRAAAAVLLWTEETSARAPERTCEHGRSRLLGGVVDHGEITDLLTDLRGEDYSQK